MNKRILLIIASGLMLAGCPSTRLYQDNPMNQDTQQRTQFTQPELLDKVLDFILQADSFDAFTMENAQRVLKLPFIKDENAVDNGFFVKGNLSGTDLRWIMTAFDVGKHQKEMHLDLYSNVSKTNLRFLDLKPVCQVDLEQFYQKLEAIGAEYKYTTEWGGINSRFYRKKDKPSVQVIYSEENPNHPDHNCIEAVYIRYRED